MHIKNMNIDELEDVIVSAVLIALEELLNDSDEKDITEIFPGTNDALEKLTGKLL